MVGSPDNKIIFEDANIADHMRQTAPDIEAFLIVQKMRNAQEFGIMAPKKGVNCFPASASIQFIKYVKKRLEFLTSAIQTFERLPRAVKVGNKLHRGQAGSR